MNWFENGLNIFPFLFAKSIKYKQLRCKVENKMGTKTIIVISYGLLLQNEWIRVLDENDRLQSIIVYYTWLYLISKKL